MVDIRTALCANGPAPGVREEELSKLTFAVDIVGFHQLSFQTSNLASAISAILNGASANVGLGAGPTPVLA
ncbi:hypothetical protein [Mycobacterium sp.]|uniref:hypothetical protein n=1 Tax=Mycobacterium sp. TaxID=1785 RepID=UPI0012753C4C|nr:hypothetical protein [Mycobacterium sp.]KAA8962449.1 MAG: hypothetical protein F6Q13_12250 [Mycobacterium sp.]